MGLKDKLRRRMTVTDRIRVPRTNLPDPNNGRKKRRSW